MSCLNEEGNADSQNRIDELAGERSHVSGAAAAAGPADEGTQQQQQPCSPCRRRKTVEGSSEWLAPGALGPPRGSSSPVKRGRAGGQVASGGASHLASSWTTSLPDVEEGTRRKRADFSVTGTSKPVVSDIIGSPNSADTLTISGKLTVAELSENTSNDLNGCSSSSSQTTGGPQAFHPREDTASRSDSKFYVDQFDSCNSKLQPEASRPIFVDKRTSKTVEIPYPTHGSKASIKSQGVKFKLELGTRETSEKGTAQGWDRNGRHTAEHRSGNTQAPPAANVPAQVNNFKSPVPNSERSPHIPKEKPAKTLKNNITSSSTTCQQPQFKIPTVGARCLRQSTTIKWQRQRVERMTPPPQQQQSEEERNILSSCGPSVPKQPNQLQLQPSRNKKMFNLHENGRFNEFVTPRRNNTSLKSCRNGHQPTGIPSPLTGLELNTNTSVPNSLSSQILPQQRYSSAISSTVERCPQLRDSRRSELPVNRAVCQQPVDRRTDSGATSLPGIVLTDEIPTRDGESSGQTSGGSSNLTRARLSAFLPDSTQGLQNRSAKENSLVEAPTNIIRQLFVCRTAEAGTQTVLSVSTSAATARTVSTTPAMHNLQQTGQHHHRATSTPSVAATIPNSLPGQNRTGAIWAPRELHPISQRVPMLFRPRPPIWQQTYQTPVSIQTPTHYTTVHPRHSDVPTLLNDPWTDYRSLAGAGASFPRTVSTPFLRFVSPHIFYAPPVEPTWVRPPVVHHAPPEDLTWVRPPAVLRAPPAEPTWVMPPVVHRAPPVQLSWMHRAPPADAFWHPLARSRHYQPRPERQPSRRDTNARVAAWLRQVDAEAQTTPPGDSVGCSSASSTEPQHHSRESSTPVREDPAGEPNACSRQ